MPPRLQHAGNGVTCSHPSGRTLATAVIRTPPRSRPTASHKSSGIGREYGKVGLTGYIEHKTITRNR
ncbi:hypothetical protein GCM10022295_81130 [Streptomyces osmaniensis]|uniref:Uncharacterized protein n=1 Tax=Streptomyces osmaniensis TaxID=593134 RepID=A0ABP6YRC3_9ACTN